MLAFRFGCKMKKNSADITLRSYSFLKGRLAEALIERLFITLGMEIYPVGFEAKLPRVAQLKSVGKIIPKAIERFEYGPDFIVCKKSDRDADNYDLFQMEVKYRKTGKISISELLKYEDDSIYFLLLDRKHIYYLRKGDLNTRNKKTSFDFTTCPRLRDLSVLCLSYEQKIIVNLFEKLIAATFDNFMEDGKLKALLTKAEEGQQLKTIFNAASAYKLP